MEQLILIVHVLAAIAIIGLILLQQGKGSDMGASFGAGASQTLFGSSGSGNALTRGTAILATLFFATSFGLAVVAKNKAVSSGDIDLPEPAVIETTSAPAIELDVPAGEMETDLDAGFDIPAAGESSQNTTPEGDIPQ